MISLHTNCQDCKSCNYFAINTAQLQILKANLAISSLTTEGLIIAFFELTHCNVDLFIAKTSYL